MSRIIPMNLIGTIDEVLADHKSGSSKLLGHLILNLQESLHEQQYLTQNDLKSLFRKILDKTRGMAVFLHFVNAIALKVEHYQDKIPGNELLDILGSYQSDWCDVNSRIHQHFSKCVDLNNKTVLLHSNSEAITGLFSYLKGRDDNVQLFQTISHPEKEGLIQASKLSELGYSVKLIEDAAVARFAGDIDCCILGIDHVANSYVVNKCGSALYAHLFKGLNKKVYALGDSRKFFQVQEGSQDLYQWFFNEPNKGDKVLGASLPENINFQNFYFEKIHMSLLQVFHEEGELKDRSEIQPIKLSGLLKV